MKFVRGMNKAKEFRRNGRDGIVLIRDMGKRVTELCISCSIGNGIRKIGGTIHTLESTKSAHA